MSHSYTIHCFLTETFYFDQTITSREIQRKKMENGSTEAVPPKEDYGGINHEEYNAIFRFLQHGHLPDYVTKADNIRSKTISFKRKCNDFSISKDGKNLLYFKVRLSRSCT